MNKCQQGAHGGQGNLTCNEKATELKSHRGRVVVP